MDINDIYEVTRDDYKYFIDQLNFEYIQITEEILDTQHKAIYLVSKNRNEKLAARIFCILQEDEQEEPEKEKYYIFSMPTDDERKEPTPRIHIDLQTREEVQAFFNILSKLQKEHENEGNLS